MNLIITNGTVIGERLIPNGAVVVIGNKILFVGEERDSQLLLKAADRSVFQIIDAQGGYIAPGLIDIHIHGSAGVDLMDGTEEALRTMARYCASSGTVGFLPSTVTASREKTRRVAEVAAGFPRQPDEAAVLGVHLEGPYINETYKGAQYGPEIREADLAELQSLYEILGEKMRLVTLAPETPGALAAIDWLVERDIAVAVGHSNATYEEASAAIQRGANHATHLYNGMRGLHHREPGVVGAFLAEPDAYVQLIADMIHVHPGAIRVALNCKPLERVILITDAVQATGLADGEYVLGDQRIFVKDGAARLAEGNLAGSTLTLLKAVKNMIEVLGVPMADAFRMASRNPAEAVGLTDKGWIREGCDADLLVLSPDLDLQMTIIDGAIAYRAVQEGGQ
ncbi:MAG: N-acetylglucosamine-6-phosphate deacetylase [Firmicutes bacterium]|jgi:N-acetylglucosamine-6-phosphate deacetylase|nr:N-acetylglucosamine-6-phosphate deacetylase [Bacillota bacterium]